MSKRILKYIKCKICGLECAQVGFQSHLLNKHSLSPDEYVESYGEYRVKKIELENYIGGNFKCLIDGVSFRTNKMLSGYVKRKYKIGWKDYLLRYYFNDIHPVCKCGCGKQIRILSYEPYRTDFISGHNGNPMTGKHHTNESKHMMSDKASLRVDEHRKNHIPLPIHTKESLIKRGEIYSKNMMDRKCSFYKVKLLSGYDEQKKGIYKFQCDVCKETYTQFHNSYFICKKCNPRVRSKYEEELVIFLKDYFSTDEIIQNYRKPFGGKIEVDIFLPSKNIGIEFNGLYWHSENSGGKDSNYHKNKMDLCGAENIRLIQIFEDEWVNNKELIKDKLLHILRIKNYTKKVFARKCEIKFNIDSNVKKQFLIKNHIQGNDTSTINVGLFYEDKLVSLMTFGKPTIVKGYRTKKDGEYELIRFCSDSTILCIGMFSKLLSHFVKQYNPTKIITYSDLCFSDKKSNVYLKNGFVCVDETKPNYWYTNDYKNRLHRFGFTKQKLVKMGRDVNKTEREIMKESGYDRIWDCGHLKYEMSFGQIL